MPRAVFSALGTYCTVFTVLRGASPGAALGAAAKLHRDLPSRNDIGHQRRSRAYSYHKWGLRPPQQCPGCEDYGLIESGSTELTLGAGNYAVCLATSDSGGAYLETASSSSFCHVPAGRREPRGDRRHALAH